ncbi:MAG: acetylglutamate kinase [Calditrichaeota bacterium]|nr:acetylglutamate kinase [Calditrichota bacterium]
MPELILKIGGSLLSKTNVLSELAESVKNLRQWNIAILHGGGPMISKLFDAFGKESSFIDGLRVTNDTSIDLVEMALSGQVNKYLARKLTALGIPTAGISGTDAGLLQAKPLHPDDPANNRVGDVTAVQPDILFALWQTDILPVISPVAADAEGNALNVNADSAAYALAAHLKANTLIFLSDVPGIFLNGKTVLKLTPETLREGIATGDIHSGMIPKLEKGFQTLNTGVETILISTWQGARTLENLLEQKKIEFTKLGKD